MLSFTPAVSYAAAYPRTVEAGDFNQDGYADLVTAGNDANVGVLLNKGDGTFHNSVGYSHNGTTAYDALVGDLNEDGQLDLTVTTTTSRILGYYYGYYGGSYPIYTNDGHVKVLLGNGDGSFTPGATHDLGELTPTSLVAWRSGQRRRPRCGRRGCRCQWRHECSAGQRRWYVRRTAVDHQREFFSDGPRRSERRRPTRPTDTNRRCRLRPCCWAMAMEPFNLPNGCQTVHLPARRWGMSTATAHSIWSPDIPW